MKASQGVHEDGLGGIILCPSCPPLHQEVLGVAVYQEPSNRVPVDIVSTGNLTNLLTPVTAPVHEGLLAFDFTPSDVDQITGDQTRWLVYLPVSAPRPN